MRRLHEKFEEVFKRKSGQTFSRQQIKALLVEAYPDFKDGSVLPNDHGRGNVNPCRCSGTKSQIFETIDTDTGPQYTVRDFTAMSWPSNS